MKNVLVLLFILFIGIFISTSSAFCTDQYCDGCDMSTEYLVTEIYIATFGRAPANAGLKYWADSVDTGSFTIDQVAQSFFDQPETQAKFPEDSSNSEFITTIYDNVLNRAPAESGLSYWVDALDSGTMRRDQAIMSIINGAKASTGSSEDAEMLAKKTEIGILFANSDVGFMTDDESFMDWATNIITFAASDDFNIEDAEDYIVELLSEIEPIISHDGTWSSTGSMITARTGLTATLLTDGGVLVAGGAENFDDIPAFNSSELYNPSTGVWSATGSMGGARAWHGAALLSNGKVLVAGGWNNGSSISTAEIYDPGTSTWTDTGSMTTTRGAMSMTLLLDGKVLTAGGQSHGETLDSAEIYDPATKSWSATGSMTTARRGHSLTLLSNGKILATGGWIKYTNIVHASAEIYDPATGSWRATGSMTTARTFHTTILLPNGKVLVSGGENGDSVVIPSAEVYDPETEVWTNTGSMTTGRGGAAASLLSNGKILLSGGVNSDSVVISSAEVYDPETEIWTITGSMTTGRVEAATVLLSTGNVLVTGGFYDIDNGTALASSELYSTESTQR